MSRTMTNKQKFEKAMSLMRKASESRDKAEEIFNSLGIKLHIGDRPIELWYGKEMLCIYEGIEAVAKINGTEVHSGQPYFAEGKAEYLHTVVDGVVISSMEGRYA